MHNVNYNPQCKLQFTMGRSWVAVEQTLKFLPLARVRNDIVYEPEASRQCHSLREQEEEISMSARLPPRNDIVSIYVKPPLNKWVNYLVNRCFGPLRRSRYIYIFTLIFNSALALTFVVFFCRILTAIVLVLECPTGLVAHYGRTE